LDLKEASLLAPLTKRLRDLEETEKKMKAVLLEKDAEIQALRMELEVYRSSGDIPNSKRAKRTS
jgi:hypothetical protein